MKAISLHQPWATAVVIGLKKLETRSWWTHHRGPLAIHSAKRRTWAQRALFEEWMENDKIQMYFEDALDLDFDCLHFGSFIGVVHVDKCAPTDLVKPDETERLLGDFSRGRFAWMLRNPLRLTRAIECRGYQRIWNVPASIEELLPIPEPTDL